MNTNPNKETKGATTIRRVLKMSGSKYPSVDPGPVINKNPIMMIAIPAANKIFLFRCNKAHLLSYASIY